MRLMITLILVLFLFLQNCGNDSPKEDLGSVPSNTSLTYKQFETLLHTLAEAWNTGNTVKAVACFTADAVYLEPPDKQIYKGH